MLNAIQETGERVCLDHCSKDALMNNTSAVSLPFPRRKQSLRRPSPADLSENIKSYNLDSISDDELPDDLIVYDIPSLESLQNLETCRKSPIKRKKSMKMSANTPRSSSSHSSNSTISSPATRASSIFSLNSNFSEIDNIDDDYHNQLSKEAKLLFSNKNYKLEESLQRISLLKHMSKQSLESVSSIVSPSSATILSESKTKSFITSTRQPNLPPKDITDIKKHEHQYQLILQTQIQIEQQKMKDLKMVIDKRNLQNKHDKSLWSKVINNYEILVKLPQTRELWWRSMSEEARAIVWQRQLTSKRRETSCDDYTELLEKMDRLINLACNYKMANDELMKLKLQKENEFIIDLVSCVEKYSSAIQLAFPDVAMFQYGATFDSILKIALAFDHLKTENKSFQSIKTERMINLICVLFYVFKSEIVTLNCFLTIIQRKLIFSLLKLNYDDIPMTLTEQLKIEKLETNEYLLDTKNQFDKFLLHMTPRLYNHFINQDVNTLKIIYSMISTVFTKQLNLDVIVRILDIYFFEGDTFLLRCLLALINKLNWKLYGSRDEIYQALNDEYLVQSNDLEIVETESINSQSTLGTKKTINTNIQTKGNDNDQIQSMYLDVGEPRDFINDVRSVLKRRN